jgi:anthranilate phosphoribosyltransferase
MVVHGMHGLDEISTLGATRITWLRDGEVKTVETLPRDFGVEKARLEDVRGTDPKGSAELTFRILNGLCEPHDPKTEIVLVNGMAGIVVAGRADDFLYGMELARESIESGAAYGKLRGLVKASGGDLSILEELESRHG